MSKNFEHRQRQRFESRQQEAQRRRAERQMQQFELAPKLTPEMKAAFEALGEWGKEFQKTFGDAFRQLSQQMSAGIISTKEFEQRLGETAKDVYEHEPDVHDEVIMPSEPTSPGVIVIFKDEGLLPQTHEVGAKASLEDCWLAVDYLIGEDLEPVSILIDTGTEFEVLAYRRATDEGDVYQDGWVGPEGNIPDEYRETEPARPKPRPGASMFDDPITYADMWYVNREKQSVKWYGRVRNVREEDL